MEKLTKLEQIRRSVLRMVADIVQRTGELAETMNGALEELERKGPWLPTDGSGAMGGDLDMAGNRIKFGDDVYLTFVAGEPVEDDAVWDDTVEETGPGESFGEEPTTEGTEEAPGEDAETEEEVTEGETVVEEDEEISEEGSEEFDTRCLELAHADGTFVRLSVADPEFNADAATKRYVDSLVGDIAALLDEINGEVV